MNALYHRMQCIFKTQMIKFEAFFSRTVRGVSIYKLNFLNFIHFQVQNIFNYAKKAAIAGTLL